MSMLFVVDGWEGWEHARVLVRYFIPRIPCRILQDSSLALIADLENISSMCVGEDPSEYFNAVNARYLVVFTQRQKIGALTRFALKESGRFESVYVVQEYWGDIIDCELPPGTVLHYFVRDEFAAALTRRRVGSFPVHVVGSPRYFLYELWDLPAIKKDVRDCLGVSFGQKLIGWFGQSPAVTDAYRRTLEKFAEAVAGRPLLKVLYRPHLRESAGQVQHTETVFRQYGVPFVTVVEEDTLRCLCAVDVVATVFSNCIADAVHLNRISPVPLNTSIYFLFDPEMVDYHAHHTKLTYPPFAAQQAALFVTNVDQLMASLDLAVDPAQLAASWHHAARVVYLGSEALAGISAKIF